ncbi:hypothetical protein CY35_20G012600 [Sphagnum magellanicum]|nr:hypothetical protein CY35_20G012600 [Sphagnum magellanicum]
MPTIQQLIRNRRQPVENRTKSPALWGCPQRRGVCTRVYKSFITYSETFYLVDKTEL